VKKVLWGGGILVVVLIAAIVVGPGLIDWNNYKDDIAKQVKVLTGRDLVIGGDVRITVLPAPAILASDVHLSNIKDATSKNMLSLKSAEVRIALAPLLSGQVKVETVRLIEPIIHLEVLADGRRNWDLQSAASPSASSAPSSGGASGSIEPAKNQAPSVIVDNFTIENGTLIYLDRTGNLDERIEGINAEIAAASLKGPYQVKGTVETHGIPLTYNVNIGEIIQDRTLTFNIKTGIAPDLVSVQLNGTVLGLPDAPRVKGNIKGGGKNLLKVLDAIGAKGLPPVIAQAFAFEGTLSGSAIGGDVKGLSMSIADSKIDGDVSVELGTQNSFAVRLNTSQLDVDRWLAEEAAASATSTSTKAASKKTDAKIIAKPALSEQTEPPAEFQIPPDLQGSVIVSVDAVKYQGGLVRDLLVNANVADGLLTLGQLSAQFPGGSDLALFGTLSADGGKPNFVGEVETTVNDLHGVLDWLKIDIKGVPSGRLRKLGIKAEMNVTPEQAQITGLDFRFDSSRLTGAATIAFRRRPSFGINVLLDRVDLDAYLPKSTKNGALPSSAPTTNSNDNITGSTAASVKPKKTSSPIAGLSVLGTFDANIKARVKSLIFRGEQVRDASVDATLFNNNLEIRHLGIGRLAGASTSVSGQLNDLMGFPKAQALRVKMNTKNLAPLMRMAGVELGIDAKKMGAFSIDTVVDGNLLKPTIKSQVQVAGATVSMAGSLSPIPTSDMFDLNILAKHKDMARLVRALGSSYRPSGKIGGLDLSLRATGTASVVKVSAIKGKIGNISLAGDATLNLAGAKPHIKAAIKTGALTIDPFLPAPQKASLYDGKWGPLRVQPVAWPGRGVIGKNPALHLAAKRGRWSANPIDLSGLNAFDADIYVEAPVVTYEKYVVKQANLSAAVKDGVLNIHKLTGSIFGGTVDGVLRVAAGTSNQVGSKIKVVGIKISDALRAVVGDPSADGRLDVDLDISAIGRSVADFVSTLGGTAAFNMKDLDVSKQTKGSVFAGVYGLVSALNQFGASKQSSRADVSGSFKVNKGVAQTSDLALVSGLGNGSAGGVIDLPNWNLNVNGQVELKQSALSRLLQAKLLSNKSTVPFSVTGPLDQPNVDVDMGAAMGSTLPIPGADLLLNKAPKGLGNVLKGILGGGGQPTSNPPPVGTTGDTGNAPPPPRNSQPPQAQPQQAQPPQKQQLNPQDLLQKLFN